MQGSQRFGYSRAVGRPSRIAKSNSASDFPQILRNIKSRGDGIIVEGFSVARLGAPVSLSEEDDRDLAFLELLDYSESIEPGRYTGSIVRFPVADEFAFYMVGKCTDEVVWLSHIDYAAEIGRGFIEALTPSEIRTMIDSKRIVLDRE